MTQKITQKKNGWVVARAGSSRIIHGQGRPCHYFFLTGKLLRNAVAAFRVVWILGAGVTPAASRAGVTKDSDDKVPRIGLVPLDLLRGEYDGSI
jgi:hypothetical protein